MALTDRCRNPVVGPRVLNSNSRVTFSLRDDKMCIVCLKFIIKKRNFSIGNHYNVSVTRLITI